MGSKDPRVDAYIENAADFAKPVLRHIRKLVHTALPEVEEDIKWKTPTFMYKGILCGMAAFKRYCAIGFWKESLVFESQRDEIGRIESVSDLPSDKTLIALVKKAAKLNDDGVKVAKKSPAARKPLEVPSYFAAALKIGRASCRERG